MEYVLVTVRITNKLEIDLKVPVNVTVQELIVMLSQALELDIAQNARIQAEPIGRILDSRGTLKSQGVDDGALLSIF